MTRIVAELAGEISAACVLIGADIVQRRRISRQVERICKLSPGVDAVEVRSELEDEADIAAAFAALLALGPYTAIRFGLSEDPILAAVVVAVLIIVGVVLASSQKGGRLVMVAGATRRIRTAYITAWSIVVVSAALRLIVMLG